MHVLCLTHWQVIKRILLYLKHTMEHGLLIFLSPTPNLVVFSNADWTGCSDDRKSTGGYCVFNGKNLICWSSKKQTTITTSRTEAKYKELWLQALLLELGIFLPKPSLLYCDNLGATYLLVNPVMHS